MAIGVVGNDKKNKLLHIKQNKYYDDTFKPDIHNENESHALICQNVKKETRVLDVGCSQGICGILLKKELNCEVYGIELDEKAVECAEKTNCYKKIYNFDICDTTSKEYKSFFNTQFDFDYIIFSDVLEHLLNPAEVVFKFGEKLKKGGQVLVSLPNIAHYDIINGLLNEKFNYSDMGLLDNTHLRFFTISSFAEYIEAANSENSYKFDLKLLGQTKINPPFIGEYPKLDEIIEKNPNLVVLQNIFSLEKIDKKMDTPNLIRLLNQDTLNLSEILNQKLDDLEKTKIINKSLEEAFLSTRDKLDYVYNEYQKIINSRIWRYTEPLRKVKRHLSEIKKKRNMSKDNKESILFFVQSWVDIYDKTNTNIGGTTLHVLDIINGLKESKNCYVLTVINNKYMLVTFDGDTQKIYDLNIEVKTFKYDKYDYEFLEMCNIIIENLNIDLLHIHHLSGFPCDVEFIIQKIKTVFTAHDYFLICPSFFLLKDNGNICQKEEKECSKCILNNDVDMPTRTTAVQNFIKNVDKFIFPDESVKEEITKYFSIEDSSVIPHGMNLEEFKIEKKNTNYLEEEKINIAFVGFINEHKGLKIIKDLVLNNRNENVVFHLFGESIDQTLNQNRNNYSFHGKYNKRDLPNLLVQNNIKYVFLLSNCLETFSYTLSEVSLVGVPIVAFDLGAIGNRVKKDNIGWLVDYNEKTTYQDIINIYPTIFNSDNYKEKVENIQKLKILSIEEMVEEINKIYNELIEMPLNNDYYKIYKFLSNYYLKYEIK